MSTVGDLFLRDNTIRHGPVGDWEWVELQTHYPARTKYGDYMQDHCHWCGGLAIATVTRRSLLTDREYCDLVCEVHAAGWLPAAYKQEARP